jgi:hypothetical protein
MAKEPFNFLIHPKRKKKNSLSTTSFIPYFLSFFLNDEALKKGIKMRKKEAAFDDHFLNPSQ